MSERERQLDEQLRDVPMPSGMLERLRDVCGVQGNGQADDLLDDHLKLVRMPALFVDELKHVPDDVSLDERISDVPLPRRMVAQLKTIAYRQSYRRLRRLAVAASLFIMISGSFWLFMTGMFTAIRPGEPMDIVMMRVPYDGPLNIEANLVDAQPPQTRLVVPPTKPRTEIDVADPQVAIFEPLDHTHGPAGELLDDIDRGLDLSEDIFLTNLLGSPQWAEDTLPELEPPPPLPRGGVALPVIRQFHRKFFLRHGVHPPIFPAAHPSLRSVTVPLHSKSTSFDRTKQLLAEGRLPDARAIRVEDFLAAVDYPFAAAKDGQVGLRVSAGPSVFGQQSNPQLVKELGWKPGPAAMLQVGVQVGRVARRESSGTHLTVAVDMSASMRWGNRVHMVQQALRRLLRNLGPHDRLSLIVFNERVLHRVVGASAEHGEQILDVIDSLRAGGGTNLAGALQQAMSVALGEVVHTNSSRRLVLLSDGNTKMDVETKMQLHELMQIAVAQGLEFSVLQMSEDRVVDPLLDELAASASGQLRRVENGSQLRRALVESLTGQSSVVARDAVLTVHFRPESVAAYRLLGHESTGLGGLLPAAVESELRAGDSPSALFEVWLKPGSNNVIGEAVVRWVDAQTGKSQRQSFEITRLQFANSFSECSLPLQQAMLAAETAEVLRNSPFVDPKSRDLSGVLQLANFASQRLAARREFQQFIRFVEDVQRVRSRQGRD